MRNIREIQAPNKISDFNSNLTVFLAGGISNCRNWQDEVIKELYKLDNKYDLPRISIFNPRQDADMKDIDPVEQIKWEHRYLELADIFSVFFCDSESLQPRTLYELGKYGREKTSIITVEKGYKREEDILVQSYLDGLWVSHLDKKNAVKEHARQIMHMAKLLRR